MARTKIKTPPVVLAQWPRLPFVGRKRELAQVKDSLAVAPAVVISGPLGVGKTRLVRELAPMLAAPVSWIRCEPGDRLGAIFARAERAVRAVPGGLAARLTSEVRVLVFDDAHHLTSGELSQLLESLAPGPTGLGRLLVIARDSLSIPGTVGALELAMDGLTLDDSHEFWRQLEATWGKAAPGALAQALSHTRGLPLGLRREYARSICASDAWTLASMPRASQLALEALVGLQLPAAVAATVAMLPDLAGDASSAAQDLLRRQLVDIDDAERLWVHDVVRDEVRAQLEPARLVFLHRRAAEVIGGSAGTAGGASPTWKAGDAGAIFLDPVDRFRQTVIQLLAAEDHEAAVAMVLASREVITRRGARGELESLLTQFAADRPELTALRVELALRAGRITEAAALAEQMRCAPLFRARLALARGELEQARQALAEVTNAAGANQLAAGAMAVELAVLSGRADEGEILLAGLTAQRQVAGDDVGIRLAQARCAEFRGNIAAARTLLQQLGSLPLAPEVLAEVHARRAACLSLQGRITEATAALEEGQRLAAELDASAATAELVSSRAAVMVRLGQTVEAEELLRGLLVSRRQFGDELVALRAELELAELLAARGDAKAAAELASAVRTSAARAGLGHYAARAALVLAKVDVLAVRLDSAIASLEQLLCGKALDAASRGRAEVLQAEARALSGQCDSAIEFAASAGGSEVRDALDRELAVAQVAAAAGAVDKGLAAARAAAASAETLARSGDLASALGIVARLDLARGDRTAARAAAIRAVREAARTGQARVRIHALLALAALARDDDDASAALSYARDAADLADHSGLSVERLVAHAALDGIAGAEVIADPASPTAATMTPLAIATATRLLADLGLTAQRPFRIVDCTGAASDVADANPEVLRLPSRSLAVDAVRETIWRRGQELADLRRRSLLKRLLFLFAAAPGRVFSKEDIVQTVWNVEYHPLRHDAALFTNIMRIRRLLGEDGAEIIRVTEDGYRFVPPRDYVFVQAR
jgi:tetratricopeptide (TPR) repeat protein